MDSKQVLREAVEWMLSGGNPQQVNWQAVKTAVDNVTRECPCGMSDCCKRELWAELPPASELRFNAEGTVTFHPDTEKSWTLEFVHI